MKLDYYPNLAPERWNRACEDSEQAWLFHRHEWISLEERFWAEGNYSFGILGEANQLIGILPLYLRKNGLGRWTESVLDSGLHRQTGLALVRGLSTETVHAAQTLSMNHLLQLADRLDVDRVQLNAHNLAPQCLLPQQAELPFWAADARFQLGLHFGPQGFLPMPGRTTACVDQIVRLDGRDEPALFGSLSEPCRRAVRKAIRSQLAAAWGEAVADVHDYYRLAQLSAQRSGEPLPPKEYYQSMFDVLHASGRCRILFARHEHTTIGALWLLVDKQAVNFMAGVSDPGYLSVRVNEFMHWSAIQWAKREGHRAYRLGPIFPDVPEDWPIHRVSRFKKKFGGDGVPIIQGSLFRKPDRYVRQAASRSCHATKPDAPAPNLLLVMPPEKAEGLCRVLRPYGVLGLPHPTGPFDETASPRHDAVIFAHGGSVPGLTKVHRHDESGGQLYYARPSQRWSFRRPRPAYRALLPHTSFTGEALEPVWVNEAGRAVIARLTVEERKILLIGLDVVEEMIRYRQGDPGKVGSSCYKGGMGFDFERPNYLFADQLLPAYRTVPWADHLGFFLAETLSCLSGYPLIEPLPEGARGAVMLTGDDDQAYLEKYEEQLRVIGDVPITYFLVPQTRHTAASLAGLPPNVEIGLHPDALDQPEAYDRLCADQAKRIRDLSGRRVRTVRNHGFLNKGYLGHLPAWETNDLVLDLNCPGVDGTALNGSFLPMRVRRADGSWSGHYSLLTLFGDGMIGALHMSERQAARRIRQVAGQMEASHPGVLVCNFHPQNVADTGRLHREVRRLTRRPGWVALGADSYLDWLETVEGLGVARGDGGFVLTSPRPVTGLVLRVPVAGSWQRRALAPWSGRVAVCP